MHPAYNLRNILKINFNVLNSKMPLKQRKDDEKVRTKNDNKEILELCQHLFNELRSYKGEDGRILSENFYRLASKKYVF